MRMDVALRLKFNPGRGSVSVARLQDAVAKRLLQSALRHECLLQCVLRHRTALPAYESVVFFFAFFGGPTRVQKNRTKILHFPSVILMVPTRFYHSDSF